MKLHTKFFSSSRGTELSRSLLPFGRKAGSKTVDRINLTMQRPGIVTQRDAVNDEAPCIARKSEMMLRNQKQSIRDCKERNWAKASSGVPAASFGLSRSRGSTPQSAFLTLKRKQRGSIRSKQEEEEQILKR